MFLFCSAKNGACAMMARQFESGFYLVEQCRREVPLLTHFFPANSPMTAALDELAAAAAQVESLLSASATVPACEGAGDA
jgi:hypothetical protein